MVQGKTSPNKGLLAGLIGTGVLAVVIGCGGGGSSLSGTNTTGSNTTTTTTGSTTSTSSATGTTTSTSTSTGTVITGSLPANVIIYNFVDPNDSTAETVDVDYISQDGTGQTSYATFNNTSYSLASPNPNPNSAKTNAFAFAYLNSSSSTYDIWVNSTVSITNATAYTTSGFSSIGTIQWSPDGANLVFTAVNSTGSSELYVYNVANKNLRTLDSADDAYLADDNMSIAYTKEDASGNGQIWTIHIDGTNIKGVTSDAFDHFNPQWSKDATRLAWSASPTGSGYDVYQALPDGTQLTQITNLNGDAGISPSFSTDGQTVAFVDIPQTDITKAGVYYVGINGLGLTQVTAISSIEPGLYWTSSNGTLSAKSGKLNTPVIGQSYHIKRLKKQGRWHYK